MLQEYFIDNDKLIYHYLLNFQLPNVSGENEYSFAIKQIQKTTFIKYKR